MKSFVSSVNEKDRVLVVEDDPSFQRMVSALLESNGFAYSCASTANEARDLLSREPIDVVVADILLPGNENLEFVEDMVGMGVDRPPVILMTAYPTTATLLRSRKLPVFAYLTKPFENEELIETVADSLTFRDVGRRVVTARRRLSESLEQLEDLERLVASPLRVDQSVPISFYLDLTLQNILDPLTDLCGLVRSTLERSGYIESGACKLFKCPRLEHQLQAISEAVDVLAKTKGSFQSKELGDLRKKLERLTKLPN